jgi:hypothetical protein
MMQLVNGAKHGGLSQRTRAEHDALLAAMHQLEAALASPAPGREREWASRVAREIMPVYVALRAHAESAECPEGLFAELEFVQPAVAARIAELRQDHRRLLSLCADLCQAVSNGGKMPDFAAVRGQAAELLAALRRHHAFEVDLIFEAFWTDIGVGD